MNYWKSISQICEAFSNEMRAVQMYKINHFHTKTNSDEQQQHVKSKWQKPKTTVNQHINTKTLKKMGKKGKKRNEKENKKAIRSNAKKEEKS